MTSYPRPKTAAERLQWMADNLTGFRPELEAVEQCQRRHTAESCTAAPARSEARTAAAVQRAALQTTGYAYTPRVKRGQTGKAA